MKKLISALAVVALFSPFLAFASFDTNLHYGSTGPDVVALQEFLIDQGVLAGQATGNFYSLTLKAVKLFQTKEGIAPVSGYVGSITRGVINNILTMQAPDSEGNATTTKPTVDLSQPQTVQPENVLSQGVAPSPAPSSGTIAPSPIATSTQVSSGALPFDNQRDWPVNVQVASTSVTFQLENDSTHWGDVVFQGQTILTKQGNEIPINYEGQVFPVHARTWYRIDGLSPMTAYSYDFVYHQADGPALITTKTFRTNSE